MTANVDTRKTDQLAETAIPTKRIQRSLRGVPKITTSAAPSTTLSNRRKMLMAAGMRGAHVLKVPLKFAMKTMEKWLSTSHRVSIAKESVVTEIACHAL